MSEYNILSDLLIRINAVSQRITRLETFEQPKFGFHLYKTTTQSIPSVTYQPVSFDTVFWSNGNYTLAPANTFVAPTAGRYLVVVRLEYTTASLSSFYVRINHNNTYYHVQNEPTGILLINLCTAINADKNDTISVEANNAGDAAAVSISGSTNPYQSYFAVALL